MSSRDFQISRRSGECPCCGCPDRKSGCHDRCRKGYKEWKAEGKRIDRNRRTHARQKDEAFRHDEQRREWE